MIIDIHTHPFGFPSYRNLADKIKTTADVVGLRTKYPDLYNARFTEVTEAFVDELVAEMDVHGVGKALIQAIPGPAKNEIVANAVRKYPDRLFGLFRIGHDQEAEGYVENPESVRNAAPAEIDHCVTNMGFIGMGETMVRALTTEIHPEHIARDLRPVMDTVSQKGIPIMFPTGWTQFPGQLYFADPVFVDEIAARYPSVPIILTKMGRGIEHYFQSALAVAMRNANIYFDTVGTTPQHLKIAVDMIGAERIMFGTDWSGTWKWVREPADLYTMRLKTIRDAKLSPDDEEKILWKTASKLFGL
jgi:uncharacterized protein